MPQEKQAAGYNDGNTGINASSLPVLLTYLQAAKLLGVSDRTVWTLVNEGKLKVVRFAGRTVRIDRRDLDQFIENHKSPTSLRTEQKTDSP